MRGDAPDLFTSPATLFTGLLDAGRRPTDLAWRLGSGGAPGRWFVAEGCDPGREVVVDRRGWPEDDGELLPRLLEYAVDEWRAGAPLPKAWLREAWARWAGPAAGPLDDDTLRRLLPLRARLCDRPLHAGDAGRLFALLMQHPVEGRSLPVTVPVRPADDHTLGTAAPLAGGLLRLRVLDAEPASVGRFVAAGWVAAGDGPFRRPGPAAEAVLGVLPGGWLVAEFEVVPPDRRPVLGEARLGERTVLAAPTGSSR